MRDGLTQESIDIRNSDKKRKNIKRKYNCCSGTTAVSTKFVVGAVVECLTGDREAAGSSLTGVTALCSLSKTHLS